MKANELMIGDLVQLINSHNPVIIDSIVYDSKIAKKYLIHFFFVNDGDARWNYSPESFEPIPLTAEILEKNGFENDFYEEESVVDYHTIRLKGYSLKHNIGDINGYLVTWCNGALNVTTDFHGCVQKEIAYVHELQHALRLCGIDKEITI